MNHQSQAIDYPGLLAKYIQHVGYHEGIDFIDQCRSDPSHAHVVFTPAEIQELYRLAERPVPPDKEPGPGPDSKKGRLVVRDTEGNVIPDDQHSFTFRDGVLSSPGSFPANLGRIDLFYADPEQRETFAMEVNQPDFDVLHAAYLRAYQGEIKYMTK